MTRESENSLQWVRGHEGGQNVRQRKLSCNDDNIYAEEIPRLNSRVRVHALLVREKRHVMQEQYEKRYRIRKVRKH